MNKVNDAFDEGYQAHVDGFEITDNPYEYDSDNWKSWRSGFHASESDYEEQP